jgi:hypothetical protein
MFLSRSGGLSCIDSSSQLSEDDRICFSGLHAASSLSGPLSGGNSGNNNGRPSAITPSVLLTLSLQLAIRLITNAEYGPSLNVSDSLLSTRSVMDELLDAANYCQASSFSSSLCATALGFPKFSGRFHPGTSSPNLYQDFKRQTIVLSDHRIHQTRCGYVGVLQSRMQ